MTSTQITSQHEEIRVLEADEMEHVAGGALWGVDVSQMPDRSIICGTIWVMDQIFKLPRPRA
jgi:hypothetical protein